MTLNVFLFPGFLIYVPQSRIYVPRCLVYFLESHIHFPELLIELLERFEGKLEEFKGNTRRAAIELAKDWRTDKALRRLESLLAVADADSSLIIGGNGDVIEPSDGILAIGSGADCALSATRALVAHTSMTAKDIVETGLKIAGEINVYANQNITVTVTGVSDEDPTFDSSAAPSIGARA